MGFFTDAAFYPANPQWHQAVFCLDTAPIVAVTGKTGRRTTAAYQLMILKAADEVLAFTP
jgi:UDP-N-acetylmuramoylalanine-D-glutamate ligase